MKRRVTFTEALTLAVVVLIVFPGLLATGGFLMRQGETNRERIASDFRSSSRAALDRLRGEVDLTGIRARTLSLDSDLQTGPRSILFFERIELRLTNFSREAPLVAGQWFFGPSGTLIACVPYRLEALKPYPFDDVLSGWLETLRNDADAPFEQRFEVLRAGAFRVALMQSGDPSRIPHTPGPAGDPEEVALFLFTPVRDFLGGLAGVVVTLMPPDLMATYLKEQLTSPSDVSVHLDFEKDRETQLPHGGIDQKTRDGRVESRLALRGLQVELHQDFANRLSEVRRQSTGLGVLLLGVLIILAAVAFVLARLFVKPLSTLQGVVRSFAAGRYETQKPQVPFAEFQEFIDTLFAMALEIRERAREREEALLRDAELRREQMMAELGDLRRQMNPHFLFNALNSIQSVMEGESSDAQNMLQLLSDLLRDTLACSGSVTVPLTKERQIVEKMLALQKWRFRNRLTYHWESRVDDANVHVPSLIVQTLVENAIKHGIESFRGNGHVSILVKPDPGGPRGFLCEVENRFESRGNNDSASRRRPTGTGTGLANTRRRLELLYGDQGVFELKIHGPGSAVARFWFSGENYHEGNSASHRR